METLEPIKGTYQHYKGDFYEVLGIAHDPTRAGQFVVYQGLGITEDLTEEHEQPILRTGNKGALCVCPVERFTDLVEDQEHTLGKKVPRFRLVAHMPSDRE